MIQTVAGLHCPECLVRVAKVQDDAPLQLDGSSSEEGLRFPFRYIGDYRLLEELGRGGAGIVFKAHQMQLDRIVALKIITSDLALAPRALERFRIEAEAAASLEHENIVPIYETGFAEGRYYLSMKLIEGETLAEQLSRTKSLDMPEWASTGASERAAAQCRIAAVVMKVARAIQFAHEHGILHRDLKPGNILLDLRGEPHVGDFGLAKHLERDSSLTLSGELLGTPFYMAPEQAAGRTSDLTIACDIYSIGAILYEMLTGRPPVREESLVETLHALMNKEPSRPTAVVPGVALDLEVICLKCIRKDRSERYESAQEVADELGRFLNREQIKARSYSALEKLIRLARRKPALMAMSFAAFLLCVVLLVGTPVALYRVERARAQAVEKERLANAIGAKSAQMVGFLKEVLEASEPTIAMTPNTPVLKQVVDNIAKEISSDLGSQPELESEMRATVGTVYSRLNLNSEAEKMYREALQLHNRRDLKTAIVLKGLARTVMDQGRFAEGESLAREAFGLFEAVEGKDSIYVAEALSLAARGLYLQRRFKESEQEYHRALKVYDSVLGDGKDLMQEDRKGISGVMLALGKHREAKAMYRSALSAVQNREHGPISGEAHVLHELGMRHLSAQRVNDAYIAFREAVRIQMQTLGSEHPSTEESLGYFSETALMAGKGSEAEELVSEYIAAEPVNALWRVLRGEIRARTGRLDDAIEDYSFAIQLQPENQWAWFLLGHLLCESGGKAYQEHRDAMFSLFGSNKVSKTLRRTLKTCLLLPADGWEHLQSIGYPPAALDEPNWGAFTKALLEYRQGQWERGVKWSLEALASPSQIPERDPAAYTVLAMSHIRLGQLKEARQALQFAKKLANEAMPHRGAADLGPTFHDWYAVHALLREAEELMRDADPYGIR